MLKPQNIHDGESHMVVRDKDGIGVVGHAKHLTRRSFGTFVIEISDRACEELLSARRQTLAKPGLAVDLG